MNIEKNKSLLEFNTFKIPAKATDFVEIFQTQDILDIPSTSFNQPHLILGGGSNILFTQDFSGLVIKNNISGIELISETDEYVVIKCGAGENWHQFVLHTIDNNWYGIENLSLIPGNVGASPIQNIGAYGIEAKDVIHQVHYFDIPSKSFKTIQATECDFGYRESIFKHELKNTFIITHVEFKLQKKFVPKVTYGNIQQVLENKKITTPTARDVSDAVIEIRQSKLPDPAMIGNAGSFFKNPVIPKTQFENLLNEFPNIVSYPVNDQSVKVPAGWLIDQAGWKGYSDGDIGVHDKQALVLVNRGEGLGTDIYALAKKIIASIDKKYGIKLTPEVNII